VSGAHTAPVAEAQENVEGDLNVLRTMMKDALGATHWYDTPEMSLMGIATKYFIELHHEASFDDVTVTGSSTTNFDADIKSITGHNDGQGNSFTGGVIINATLAHKIFLRDHLTENPIDDGENNEVYGRLSFSGGDYVVTFFSNKSGVETAYTFATPVAIDIAYVAVSRRYEDLGWSRFIDFGFFDVSGMVGTISQDNVLVTGMAFLLVGKTTQGQVNAKVDKLGSQALGEGASGIAIYDAGFYTLKTNVEDAIQELYQEILDVTGWDKKSETMVGVLPAGTAHTLPGGMTYTLASGANLDVYFRGQLLLEGALNDYIEFNVTQVKFNFTVPNNSNLTYMARK
jgi:hypothetical protein